MPLCLHLPSPLPSHHLTPPFRPHASSSPSPLFASLLNTYFTPFSSHGYTPYPAVLPCPAIPSRPSPAPLCPYYTLVLILFIRLSPGSLLSFISFVSAIRLSVSAFVIVMLHYFSFFPLFRLLLPCSFSLPPCYCYSPFPLALLSLVLIYFGSSRIGTLLSFISFVSVRVNSTVQHRVFVTAEPN